MEVKIAIQIDNSLLKLKSSKLLIIKKTNILVNQVQSIRYIS